MLEFALILPVFLLLTLAVLEVGLMFFTIGAARYTGGEAARQLAQAANRSTADKEALDVIDQSALRTTTLAQVTSVQVQRINGANSVVTLQNQYVPRLGVPGWNPTALQWQPSDRLVRTGCLDKANLVINYLYRPKTGLFGRQVQVQLAITYRITMEPQLVDSTPCPAGY